VPVDGPAALRAVKQSRTRSSSTISGKTLGLDSAPGTSSTGTTCPRLVLHGEPKGHLGYSLPEHKIFSVKQHIATGCRHDLARPPAQRSSLIPNPLPSCWAHIPAATTKGLLDRFIITTIGGSLVRNSAPSVPNWLGAVSLVFRSCHDKIGKVQDLRGRVRGGSPTFQYRMIPGPVVRSLYCPGVCSRVVPGDIARLLRGRLIETMFPRTNSGHALRRGVRSAGSIVAAFVIPTSHTGAQRESAARTVTAGNRTIACCSRRQPHGDYGVLPPIPRTSLGPGRLAYTDPEKQRPPMDPGDGSGSAPSSSTSFANLISSTSCTPSSTTPRIPVYALRRALASATLRSNSRPRTAS